MKVLLVVFMWWFVAYGGSVGSAGPIKTVVGPFPSKEVCDMIREEVKKHSEMYPPSICWFVGKSRID